ncbi:hypothetical protein [Aegicerativicinus sediminis]|uniref:hypothetical protein n=1 Tax=Aegicerativicinus sediminis TaxID=2893202 RepID=UPI001E5A1C52|nr:hypothetical protein [Aegicerativicinus sediminis]
MKTIINLLILIALGIFLDSCATAKIYESPDARDLARNENLIAILPPIVTIEAKKNVEAEAIKEQQIKESLNFQKEMYSWILQRKMEGKVVQEIMDIETTNAILNNAGYPEKVLQPYEMCQLLGVDATLGSNYSITKPMSTGAAVALAVVGVFGPTNRVSASLNIKDCMANKEIWHYEHEFSGSLGSSSRLLVDALMRNASKKMPYVIEEKVK